MAQIDPKPHTTEASARPRPVLGRIATALAGGASAFALSAPLLVEEVHAQGWQITRDYYRGGSTETYRELRPGAGSGIVSSPGDQPAPGNNCPVTAFEILNPRPGEVRCVGFAPPPWPR